MQLCGIFVKFIILWLHEWLITCEHIQPNYVWLHQGRRTETDVVDVEIFVIVDRPSRCRIDWWYTRLYLAYWKLLMRILLIAYLARFDAAHVLPICFARNSSTYTGVLLHASQWR